MIVHHTAEIWCPSRPQDHYLYSCIIVYNTTPAVASAMSAPRKEGNFHNDFSLAGCMAFQFEAFVYCCVCSDKRAHTLLRTHSKSGLQYPSTQLPLGHIQESRVEGIMALSRT